MANRKELRDLDAWLSEHLFGDVVVHRDGEVYWKHGDIECVISAYSSSPGSFAEVEMEITERDWEWDITYNSDIIPHYTCQIKYESDGLDRVTAEAGTWELAFCLAVKFALEAIENEGKQ